MSLGCKTPADVLKVIKDREILYVDLRFTDPRGKWQHLTMTAPFVDEDSFTDGIMFDGSSIAGWKEINESDMSLIPDATTAVMDPFAAQPMLILFCDVMEPSTGQPYGRDPRSIAKRAEAYLSSTGIGDVAYFGPEPEFFVFDDVRFDVQMNNCFYEFSSDEGPYVTGRILAEGNAGHRPPVKGGYFPVPPVDSANDLRAEMVSVMRDMGLSMDRHHHEVAPSQHELGLAFSTLVRSADNVQIYKYVTHMVAQTYGKTATFMPKPVAGDNGSGMHTHQSIWKDGKPTFAGTGYADLSEVQMRGANLQNSDLQFSDLHKAVLDRSDLTSADLSRARLTEASLVDVKFINANLAASNLRKANYKGADFTDANRRGCDFSAYSDWDGAIPAPAR